jgi:hypothetical protein
MALIGKLFGKSTSGKGNLTEDQSRARAFLGSVPGQSTDEQAAVRSHMEAELEAQRAARAPSTEA